MQNNIVVKYGFLGKENGRGLIYLVDKERANKASNTMLLALHCFNYLSHQIYYLSDCSLIRFQP